MGGPTNLTGGFLVNGTSVHGQGVPSMGKEYHVRKTTDAHYDEWFDMVNFAHHDGTYSVQTTITAALAVADDFDTIWVYPGQYKEVATLAITQDSLRLLAVQMGPRRALTRTEIRQHGNAEVDIISVEGAHNVEIAGFRLTPYNSADSNAITIGGATACYGTYIHDNYFYAPNQILCQAIEMGAGAGCDSIVIQNNDFWKGGSASENTYIIDWVDAPRSIIQGNTFTCVGGVNHHQIHCTDTTANGYLLDNVFWNNEGTAIGIYVGTPSANDYLIDGNHFINYGADDDRCIYTAAAVNCGINWNGDTVIVDS
jgi:hypothetical protein